MTITFFASLLLVFALAIVGSIWLLLRWPQLWLRLVVRVTRGRWLLHWWQLQSLGTYTNNRLLGCWLWDLSDDQVYLTGPQLSAIGFDGDWVVETRENFLSVVDRSDWLRLNQTMKLFIREQNSFTIECRLRQTMGRKVWMHLSGNILWRDKQGRAQLVIGRIEDISERKVHVGTIAAINEQLQSRVVQQDVKIRLAEQAANDLKLRLQQVLDTVPVALCWKDIYGVYLGCNQKFAALVREVSPEAVLGKTDFDLFWKDQVAEIVAEDEALVSGHASSFDDEKEIDDGNGTVANLSCHTVPLRDSQGRVIGILRAYQDTSVRRRMEMFAQKERQLMQDILDSSDAVITVVDRHYCFLRVNRYFESVLNIPANKAVGRHVADVLPGSMSQQVIQICEHIVATGQSVTQEYALADGQDKKRSFIAKVTPVLDDEGQVDKIVTVSTEVTELKLAHKALEESRNKAELAVSVKGRFLANMSHEIRTPMNAILGLSQLALANELDTKQLDYLTKIHFSAENLLGIVNDILDFSKIEAGKLALEEKAFDLRILMDNLCSIFEMRARKEGLEFKRSLAPNTPPFICADALRLHQILVNLIGNAIKFTHEGCITVEVSMRVDMGDRHILRFAVIDTGVGLSAKQISMLFEAFEQADAGVARQYGGTGLGLTISRRLVEMMGGEIKVSSEPGKGSRFEFSVNVGGASPADVMALTASVTPDSIPDFQGAKILLVEDNDINRQVASEILAPFNVEVSYAINGEEAVQKVQEQLFSLVLMDVQMPIMDGYTATKIIRQHFSANQLPILGLTANAMADDRSASQLAGMNSHIAKPIDSRELVAELQRFLPVASVGEVKPSKAAHRTRTNEVVACADVSVFLPFLDVVEGLERLRGRQDRYYDLLQSFMTQFKAGGNQSVALMEQHAFSEAKALAHQIRGIAGNLSAKRVYAECKWLEELIAQGLDAINPDQVKAQGTALQEALDELAEAVDKLIGR